MKIQFMFLVRVILAALCLPACAHSTPDPNKVWRIAVISDMNQDYGSKEYTPALKAAIVHIRQAGVHAVLSTGDMASGQKRGLDYRGMWNSFHNHVSRPLGQSLIPFLPSPGNHDASAESAFRNERDLYKVTWNEFPLARFNAGRPADEQIQFLPGVAQNFPLNYAVTMGPALFVALDATIGGGLINNQLDWLETVLQNSSAYTVKIVFGHYPLFPFTFQRADAYLADGNRAFATRMENMLEQYQVDYFLSGHHHAYFPGRRAGNVRYIGVPLLGTGSRYLLTENRTETSRSPQSFLYFEFDAAGNITMNALKSPSMTSITSSMLPEAISIPRRNASDCRECATFPEAYFLDTNHRIVYRRL